MTFAAWQLVVLSVLVGCVGGSRNVSDAGVSVPSDPFDGAHDTAPAGEPLAFGLRDGVIRNYFQRQGPVSVHVLTRSGQSPRLIAAFPANNQGIGVWFEPVTEGAELSFGSTPDSEPSAAGGELTPIVRGAWPGTRSARSAYGVRATLKSSARRLASELVLLANVRTLRDYGYGVCLEDAAAFPELRNESIELDAAGVLHIRREQIGGGHALELSLAGRAGTTLALSSRQKSARPACPLGSTGGQPRIEIRGGDAGIELELIALSDETPLTPIAAADLSRSPGDLAGGSSPDLSALAFLSYEEKLLAGSWRFLTYFGRDTLLSLWLLLPALGEHVVEAALGSVLERINLVEGLNRPEGGALHRGDVAHEEAIGDYAAYENGRLAPRPSDRRTPRYDYKMIDDDFLLAPLLVALLSRLEAAGPVDAGASAFDAFLQRSREDGQTFQAALLANLELVLQRARPFGRDARPPREKAGALVALHAGLSVGQWRDSEMGLGFGRYPFDVNAALVPAALDAAAIIYERLGQPARAAEARTLQLEWQAARELFRIELPLASARASVADYAASVGLADASSSLAAEAGENVVEYAIALDADLQPVPVQHSDHGFVLAFTDPPQAYLRHTAALLDRPFPAGLTSPAGVMVANPALAAPGLTVLNPGTLDDPADDVRTPLRELFTAAHYHGTVVWSWQQALLARGLRRQLARSDLEPATRTALAAAECGLWAVIDATREQSTRELWSWAPDSSGRPAPRAFGAAQSDSDESNAIQLWSTVYLAVQKPTPKENPRCAAAGVGP